MFWRETIQGPEQHDNEKWSLALADDHRYTTKSRTYSRFERCEVGGCEAPKIYVIPLLIGPDSRLRNEYPSINGQVGFTLRCGNSPANIAWTASGLISV